MKGKIRLKQTTPLPELIVSATALMLSVITLVIVILIRLKI